MNIHVHLQIHLLSFILKKSQDLYIILELIKINLNVYVNIYKHICNIIHLMFVALGFFKYKTE